MPKRPSHLELAALRSRGWAWEELAARYGVEADELRIPYEEEQRQAKRERARVHQEDFRRPGITVTFANLHLTERRSRTLNGPGGPLASLLALVDSLGPEWTVVSVSTPHTIKTDVSGRRTNPHRIPEADFLSRINRIGRLHPSLWPRWRDDFRAVEEASRAPLGEGTGRYRSGRRRHG